MNTKIFSKPYIWVITLSLMFLGASWVNPSYTALFVPTTVPTPSSSSAIGTINHTYQKSVRWLSKASCIVRQGEWYESYGVSMAPRCVVRVYTHDAGKVCYDYTDCKGGCLVKDQSQETLDALLAHKPTPTPYPTTAVPSGFCSDIAPLPIGCYTFIFNKQIISACLE